MKLYRITNSQGELVMIAPTTTLFFLRLVTEKEAQHLDRLRSGEKWTVAVPLPRGEQQYQFEALPLEIPQAQSGSVTVVREHWEHARIQAEKDFASRSSEEGHNGDTQEWSV